MTSVAIRGDGVAARCCAHLLSKAGVAVTMQAADRPRLPAILLSDSALKLIRDVFDQPNLFRDAPKIERRIVAWQRDTQPATLDHSGVVVSETALLDAIEPVADGQTKAQCNWTIFASPPLPASSAEHRFGSRIAWATKVEANDSAACVIESLERGWLFLLPGWLLSLGGPAETLLRESRVVAGRIIKIGPSAGSFSASPRIMSPLCGPDWLACGTAAMAFDPICGDGTAHAIREGILAAAVIRSGGDVQDLLLHFEARLIAGFKRHLTLCLEFYSSGFGGPWWEAEARALQNGIAWCEARQTNYFKYRLTGFDLQAVE